MKSFIDDHLGMLFPQYTVTTVQIKIVLMEELLHQLRLVIYPFIYKGFYTSKRWLSALGFLNPMKSFRKTKEDDLHRGPGRMLQTSCYLETFRRFAITGFAIASSLHVHVFPAFQWCTKHTLRGVHHKPDCGKSLKMWNSMASDVLQIMAWQSISSDFFSAARNTFNPTAVLLFNNP